MNIKSGRRGTAIITAMITLAVLGMIVAAYLLMVTREHRMTYKSFQFLQALNLAEAGVESAIWELDYGGGTWSGWDRSGNPYTRTILSSEAGRLSTGDIDISITDPTSSTPQIDAIGYVPNKTSPQAERQVTVRLEKPISPIFDYCVATQVTLTLENITTGVFGDVHSNGNIVDINVNVTGAGTAVGTITIEGGGFSEGWQGGASEVTVPTLDLSYYQAEAGYVYNGDWTVSGTLNISDYSASGIIYVGGDFKGQEVTIVGPGIIVADGTIRIEKTEENDTVVGSADGMVGLFSNSCDSEEAVKIESGSSCYTTIFAPNGGVAIETTSSLYGSVVANTAQVETGSQLVYTDSSGDIDLPRSTIFSVAVWSAQ